ncbi:MAG: stage III sporulation protein AC [Eubacteriales bacterium]|nr:stage III sporulation protein AC [Eubacteriales bacterium]
MEINIIFKIAAVGIVISILNQVLKHSGREEQAFLTTLAGLVIVLYWIVPYIVDLFDSIKKLLQI